MSSVGALGGQVQNAALTIATADRVALATGKAVTVAFTLQTALAIGDLVTINYPSGFFLAGVATPFTQSPASIFTTPGSPIGATSFTVTAAAVAAVGTYTLTFTAITMGPPQMSDSMFSISTTRDCVSTVTSTGSIGGIVSATTLTIAAVDRVSAVNRKIVIGFNLATALVSTGTADTITIRFPVDFISGTPATPVTGTITPSAAAMAGPVLVLTATAAIPLGPQTITVCGLTLANFVTDGGALVTVTTSKDYTNTCASVPTIGSTFTSVTGLSMSIPFTSRSVNTVVTPVFVFKTTALIPEIILRSSGGCAAALNSISVSWPLGFFAFTPAGACGTQTPFAVSGLPSGYSLSSVVDGTFVLTGSASIAAGSAIALTVSGVSLKSTAFGGDDRGITVVTTTDVIAASAATGPISGYQVTAVSLPTCRSSAIDCQPFVITFNSLATVAPGQTILITFSDTAAHMPLSGTPDAFTLGGVLFTGSTGANAITLTADSRTGSFVPGSSAITLTLTGMKITTTTLGEAALIPVYMSAGGAAILNPSFTSSYASMLVATGTTTTTTSLQIDKPFPGVTGARATVSFTTTTALSAGGEIFLSLPLGFFVAFSPVINSCIPPTESGKFTATTATPCVIMSARNIQTIPSATRQSYAMIQVTIDSGTLLAGANSFVLSGVTLSAAAVAASTTFRVTTLSDVCSLGAVTTGSISNSNPGGPAASSATSAIVCMAISLGSLLLTML